MGEAVSEFVWPLFIRWRPTASPLPHLTPRIRHSAPPTPPCHAERSDASLRPHPAALPRRKIPPFGRNDQRQHQGRGRPPCLPGLGHTRGCAPTANRLRMTDYGVKVTGLSYQVGTSCTQVLPICRGKGVPSAVVKVSRSLRPSRCQVTGYCCPSRKMKPVPLPHS